MAVKSRTITVTTLTGTAEELLAHINGLIVPKGQAGYQELDNVSVASQLDRLPPAQHVGPRTNIVRAGKVFILKTTINGDRVAVSLEYFEVYVLA